MNRAQRRAMEKKQFRGREKEIVQDVAREQSRKDYVAYMYAMKIVGEALRRVPGIGPKRMQEINDRILEVEREKGIERLPRELDGMTPSALPLGVKAVPNEYL